MYKVAVIGGGSWGTTLANLIAEEGHEVRLWVREEQVCEEIRTQRINSMFLPGVSLSDRLLPSNDLAEVLDRRDLILMVVPSHVFRDVLERMKGHVSENAIILSATKGIENGTLMLMSDIVADVLHGFPKERFGCLAGPSFAKEVSRHYPTAITVACKDQQKAIRLQEFLYREYFRIYVSQDVVGVQLAGALKNVIAIAAGACDGLGFGHNARAALITRGLAEITRLG
ncbi:MAG: glycerol-3-phosphate dehydrogenase, partial [Deltaproteobacteria bacterium]